MSRIFCCDRVLESNFCPDCGKGVEEAKQDRQTPYPHRFDTYLHGDKGEGKQEIMDELGLDWDDPDDSVMVNKVSRCDYEVKLTFEITDENSDIKLVAVDGMEISDVKLGPIGESPDERDERIRESYQ